MHPVSRSPQPLAAGEGAQGQSLLDLLSCNSFLALTFWNVNPSVTVRKYIPAALLPGHLKPPSELPLMSEGTWASLMAPNTAPSFRRPTPQLNKGRPHGNEAGSERNSRQLSPKRNFLSSASPSNLVFQDFDKGGNRGRKKSAETFFDRGPEKEVERYHKNREVRHGDTGQGTLTSMGGASVHSPGQIGLFQPADF